MKKGVILVAEDEETNRKLLCRLFRDDYDVLEAADGEETIALIESQKDRISAVLLDLIMPNLDGFGVMEYMQKKDIMKKMPVVLITMDTSNSSKEKAFALGVSDVVEKPYDSYVIRKRIQNLIDLWMHKNQLEKLVEQQTEKILEQNHKIKDMNYRIYETLGTVVEFRNLESNRHILRVRELTRILITCLGKCYPEYGLTGEEIDNISYASALHDIGKIAIPDNILLKPGRLTDEEYAVMKTHTLLGSEILERVTVVQNTDFMKYCEEIVRSHHEKYDGKGYPDGLVGDQIPISAQVVSLADVYEALVSDRVYKAAYSFEESYYMILSGDCGVYNPKLINSFKIVRRDFEKLIEQIT
jgi:putative two-component system response regulator